MWNIGRHVDEITGGGLGFEFQTLAPSYASQDCATPREPLIESAY
jgi:hypothetical protein